jgi:hypothetical protein
MEALESWFSKELPLSAKRARKVVYAELQMQRETLEALAGEAQSDLRRQFARWSSSPREELLGFCKIA